MVLSRIVPRASTEVGIDPQGISSEPEEVAAYLADPLVHGRASMRWGAEILRTMTSTRERAAEFARPLLLMHGALDTDQRARGQPGLLRGLRPRRPDAQDLSRAAGTRSTTTSDAAGWKRDLLRWLGERCMRAEASPPAPVRSR